MTYNNVDKVAFAVRAAGDLQGRVVTALVKKAIVQIPILEANTALDQNEWKVITLVLDGDYPVSWIRTVIGLIDVATQLPDPPTATSPTDAQIDTQVNTAWPRFISSRKG